ncbi:MAG TPA: CPBP family intramembrane glutamic endopeptidase [Xanthomonadaceae bacterium]|nr:CPBP family intramembrane glutamic endopeptidase [Xanthomonadaceae bacterium]
MNAVAGNATGRVRRILDFPLTCLALEILLVGVPLLFARDVGWTLASRMHSPALQILAAIAIAALGYAWYVLYARLVARRQAAELAIAGAPRGIAAGALLGCLLNGTLALLLFAVGALRISSGGPVLAALVTLASALMSGVIEEVLLRGIVFRNLEDLLGSWAALALSAALFGALHLGNPHATISGAVAIALSGGVLLAAIYMATRSLWWAIGVHWGWNLTEGALLGVRVSGVDTPGLLHSVPSGPDWLSGGEFGIEASVAATAICLLATLWFLRRAWHEGRVFGPWWRRKPQLLEAR